MSDYVCPKCGNDPERPDPKRYACSDCWAALPNPEGLVPVHAGNCNDYNGCQPECRWMPRTDAVMSNGLWRAAQPTGQEGR